MRGVPQAMRDALWDASGLLEKWDLFTLVLPSGTQRWTDSTADVVVGGVTWSATAPVIRITGGVSDVGMSVDTRDVELGGSFTIGGQTLQQIAIAGGFDDCAFVWERAYALDGPIVGKVERFTGLVVDAQPWSTGARLRVKSRIATAEQEVPSRSFQVACPWGFGTVECGHTKQPGETCQHNIASCVGFSNITHFGGYWLTPPAGSGS